MEALNMIRVDINNSPNVNYCPIVETAVSIIKDFPKQCLTKIIYENLCVELALVRKNLIFVFFWFHYFCPFQKIRDNHGCRNVEFVKFTNQFQIKVFISFFNMSFQNKYKIGISRVLNLKLTSVKRAKIDVLKDECLSNREISRRINHSATVVCNYVNLGDNYGINKSRGIQRKLTSRQVRLIVRKATYPSSSSTKIQNDLHIPVTARRLKQVLNRSGIVKWVKKSRKTLLNEEHKRCRFQFAKDHMA